MTGKKYGKVTGDRTSHWVAQSPKPYGAVEWDGWQAIDAHETALGKPQGRPRVKLVRVDEMRDVASGALR